MSGTPAPEGASVDAIAVVAAVIIRNGRLLLCQRPDGPHLPMLWEFPGGKIDAGETPEQALVRELREELGVAACVGPMVHEVLHAYPEKRVWIRFFLTRIEGEPTAMVHRALRWAKRTELRSFAAPPPNAEVIRLILDESLPLGGGELEIH